MEGVTGIGELEAVARRFAVAGSGGLEDAIGDRLEAQAHKLDEPIRDSLESRLPSGGSLNRVAADGLSVDVARGSGASLAIEVRAGIDIEALDQGVVHHPTYGNAPSVTQSVPQGTVSDPLERAEDGFGEAAEEGIARTARYVERGII